MQGITIAIERLRTPGLGHDSLMELGLQENFPDNLSPFRLNSIKYFPSSIGYPSILADKFKKIIDAVMENNYRFEELALLSGLSKDDLKQKLEQSPYTVKTELLHYRTFGRFACDDRTPK